MTDAINPPHYRAGDTYETIRVIEAWGLGYHLGNAVKYISRAGKKDASKYSEDLEKAIWYLRRAQQEASKTAVESPLYDLQLWIDGEWATQVGYTALSSAQRGDVSAARSGYPQRWVPAGTSDDVSPCAVPSR